MHLVVQQVIYQVASHHPSEKRIEPVLCPQDDDNEQVQNSVKDE